MYRCKFSNPVVTIPDHWSADEALVVVSFLKRISESIWATHGHEMAQRLYRSDDQLCACLDHLLAAAGNSALMTTELKTTLAEHSAGNYRVLMNLADELLCEAGERELAQLDETLFLDVFQPPATKKRRSTKRKR